MHVDHLVLAVALLMDVSVVRQHRSIRIDRGKCQPLRMLGQYFFELVDGFFLDWPFIIDVLGKGVFSLHKILGIDQPLSHFATVAPRHIEFFILQAIILVNDHIVIFIVEAVAKGLPGDHREGIGDLPLSLVALDELQSLHLALLIGLALLLINGAVESVFAFKDTMLVQEHLLSDPEGLQLFLFLLLTMELLYSLEHVRTHIALGPSLGLVLHLQVPNEVAQIFLLGVHFVILRGSSFLHGVQEGSCLLAPALMVGDPSLGNLLAS
mmetsp:Transcript_34496/g.33683  ORF Transcript_34496/g.33683 Transcript_34496/m.33683 type:complete len:267 (+) Transcript_34496:162-962(+)